MNGPSHLNLARRDLSSSYEQPGGDHRLLSERQLYATQAQAHALISLVCTIADAVAVDPSLEQHVADAMAVVSEAAVPAEVSDGPVWRCHSTRHSMRCQHPEGHQGDHEYADALGGYAWTDTGDVVEAAIVPLEQLQPPVTAPLETVNETGEMPSTAAALRLVPPYLTTAAGAHQRGMS